MNDKQKKEKPPDAGCLVCKKSSKTLRKGLCPSHYAQYSRARELALAKGLDVDSFDADLIKQGLLAEDARQSNNPFASALAKFEAKKDVLEAEKKLEEKRRKQSQKPND